MSDLQRKIAEIKGWTELGTSVGRVVGKPPGISWFAEVPNWHTDLTLARELEDELDSAGQYKWGLELLEILHIGRMDDESISDQWVWDIAHATAAQRGQAWCKVKEKK